MTALTSGYTPEMALRICEAIASGDTLVAIAENPDFPSRNTIYRWLSLYPKFFDAFQRAKELSAMSLEEEALLMARTLKDKNDFTSAKVQAYSIAMQQLRWSAARRNPEQYGQRTEANTKVPITFTTTLNIGQDGKPATDNTQSIYTVSVSATVGPEEAQGEAYPASPLASPSAMRDITPASPDLDLAAETDDNTSEPDLTPAATTDQPFGVPDTVTGTGGLGRRKAGRPPGTKKGHKSPTDTLRTARRYAAQERKRLAKQKASED